MDYKYVIVGAGNGGQSLAGDMALRGTKPAAIYDKNPAPIEDIKKAGGIKMSGPVVEGFAPIEHPTASLDDAMKQGNVFLVTIVANFHSQLAKEMAPYIKGTDIVLLIPGNTGSSLIFRKTLQDCGVKDMPLIGETLSMPYATRLLGPAHAGIKARKLALPMGALPASRNDELLKAISPAIPEVTLWKDAFSVGMNNINPCGHVPHYLFNIGKVEAPTPADFDFHAWHTKTTERVGDLYDKERISVMKALGLAPLSYEEGEQICYKGKHYVPIKQEGKLSENAVQVPDRFIDEDVPLNMVPVAEMGRKLGIPTPVTDLLIDISNLFRETDFRKSGVTMEKMGITDLSPEGIQKLVG